MHSGPSRVRLHRAIGWLGRAGREVDHVDAHLIALIAARLRPGVRV